MTDDARWNESMPEVYDRVLGPALFTPFADHLAAVAATIEPRHVLEIAAGTGAATRALVRLLPDAKITATDLNPGMVVRGAERVPEARWQIADAQAVDADDDSFDFVARVPHGYFDPAVIEADLRAGGFAEVSIDRVTLTGRCPSAEVLAEGFCLGTPLRFALTERGPLDELTRAVADEMTRRLGEGPVTGDLAALVVIARA